MSRCYDYQNIFYDVDKIGEGLIAISYFENKSQIVTGLIERMQSILEDEYDDDVIESIFGYRNNIRIERSANRSAQKHLKALAARSQSNPQGTENDVRKPKRVQILYGSEPIKNDTSSTYAAAAKINTSKTNSKPKSTTKAEDSSQIAELCASIEKLDQHQKQLEQSVTTNITTNVMSDVTKKINELDTRINTRITRIETTHSETIDTKKLIMGMCNGNSPPHQEQQAVQTPSTTSEQATGITGVIQ